MRPLLRQVHLYIGVGLSLLLLVLAVTGSALVLKKPYWRAVYPELRAPAPDLGPADHAAAAARASAYFGDALRSVKLPEPGVPAYHLYLEDGEAFLSATDHAVIDEWGARDRPMAFLFDLHAHLMAGDAGHTIGGVAGILGALLAITGVILWWPSRRRFSLRTLWPRDLTRRLLLISHRDLGTLTAPILILLLLTGSGMVFHAEARALLNGVFGDAVAAEPAPLTPSPVPAAAPSAPTVPTIFARALEVFPDARLVFYYPPADPSAAHGFRLRRPCELHPNGRSYVHVDPAGGVLRSVDACAAAPGDRATHAIYPLHAGMVGSTAYTVLTFIGGVALALISATGAGAYLLQLSRQGPRSRRGQPRRRSRLAQRSGRSPAAPRPAARPVAHPQRKL